MVVQAILHKAILAVLGEPIVKEVKRRTVDKELKIGHMASPQGESMGARSLVQDRRSLPVLIREALAMEVEAPLVVRAHPHRIEHPILQADKTAAR